MPRTGTGPFPAQRSSVSFPGGPYGFAVRDTQFAGAPHGHSYGPPATGQHSLAVPGSYYRPVAAPAQNGLDQDGLDQDGRVQGGRVQDGRSHDEPGRPAQWPLQSRLELGPLPGAVPCARLHARLVLTEWGRASLGDSVELIVSELMTNALRASTDTVAGRPGYGADGRQQPLGLRLESDRRQVLVEVWDGVTAPPVPGQVTGPFRERVVRPGRAVGDGAIQVMPAPLQHRVEVAPHGFQQVVAERAVEARVAGLEQPGPLMQP